MSIDAYDILGVEIDCDQEEIKKAFKKASLKEHPDKAIQNGRSSEEQNDRFIKIKEAHEILEEADRRKRYDTFGQDLGKEPPEMEVWNIGLATLLQPMGAFSLKTMLCRLALWFLGFRYLAYLLLLCGIIAIVLYSMNANIPKKLTGDVEMSFRSQEAAGIMIMVGVIDVVIILSWIWAPIGDTVVVLYLCTEVITLDSLKLGGIALVISLFLAWLAQGWWYWILGFEVLLAIVLLIGVTIAAGIVRLWIDSVQASRSEKVKEWRIGMRHERKKLQDEIDALKRKLNK